MRPQEGGSVGSYGRRRGASIPVSSRFRSSPKPFFEQHRTHRSIDALSAKDHLIIYCGAGVTFDRTQLEWTTLINELFSHDNQHDDRNASQSEISELLEHWGPMLAGSALKQAHDEGFSDTAQAESAVRMRLCTALYAKPQWSIGSLTRNISLCAIAAVQHHKQVTIVTTNYDQFIEDEIGKRLEQLWPCGVRKPAIRSEYINAQGKVEAINSKRISRNKNSVIRIVHLHGFVGMTGEAKLPLVLTELDYAGTRDHVSRYLRALFSDANAGAIVAGSSLTDPPLIDALASLTLNKRDRAEIFALLPYEGTRFVDPAFDTERTRRLASFLVKRGKLLGVEVVLADFYSQVAQFFLELKFRYSTDQSYADWDGGYVKRLNEWRDSWAACAYDQDPATINRRLIEGHQTLSEIVRGALFEAGEEMDDDDITRLELWARTGDKDGRYLQCEGTSSVIVNERIAPLRREAIALHSRVAAIQAITSGRPLQLNPSDQARENKPDLMWKSFLAVPILDPLGMGVPVGSIVLASTHWRSNWGIYRPLKDSEKMRALVDHMVKTGREILITEPSSRSKAVSRRQTRVSRAGKGSGQR